MGHRVYLRDEELAKVLRISPKTLRNVLSGYRRGGNKRRTLSSASHDLMELEPEDVGGFRLWKISMVAKKLKLSEEDVRKAAEV